MDRVRALERLVGPEELPAVAEARERLERGTFVLAVVGEFSSGKSYLLNALLGTFRFENVAGREEVTGLLATDINPSTATITEIEYGSEPLAHAYHEDGRVERIPLDRLEKFVAAEKDAPARVVVQVDSEFLRRGFAVADTPGLASIDPAHRRATLQFLPGADAVLYLIDTQQPFSEGDASFLGIIRQHLDTIFIVQTKIDMWEHAGESGEPAWRSAQERITQLAAIHAPGTYVYALSARRYVEGVLRGDEAAIEASRFIAFREALDASLVRNTGRARLRRARDRAREAAADATARIERDLAMLALGPQELRRRRAVAEPEVAALSSFVASSRAELARSAERIAGVLADRGEQLAGDAERALAQAFDTADVARLRDRARLHILVDRTLAETVEGFGDEVASVLTRDYERAIGEASERLPLRFSFASAAASAFGSNGSSSVWNEDPCRAICATIVLDAIGGPAIGLVHEIASRFAAHPPGSYMKRELTADLRSSIFPEFRDEMRAFGNGVARKIAAIGTAYAAALETALGIARDGAIGSIDRALQAHAGGDAAAAPTAMRERMEAIRSAAAGIDDSVGGFLARDEEIGPAQGGSETVRRAHVDAEFDREAYELGLRPQRWRVAVLGALRRGKSSLINAFAGRRVLADEVAGAIAYPVHVRYGDQERAYALGGDATWREVEVESALEEATRNPVLILTPWKLPRELVLVHAPAFDAGDATGEDVCMVTARAASEVLCLFSRQLSDRELALYERVADAGKPMMFVHTLADNENSAERRHVVELANEYLAGRSIPAKRIFTVSTLEYAQAKRESRAPAGWNELDALISTVAAHAEEHMARLERLQRAAGPAQPEPVEQAAAQKRSGLFARLFGK